MSSAPSAALPPLCEAGHVLVVTVGYPPLAAGSSVIMANLLSRFDPKSYAVVTENHAGAHGIEDLSGATVHRILKPITVSMKLNKRWRDVQLPRMANTIADLIKQHQSKVVVGVYPDFHFLHAAREAARRTKTPLLAYMHDTLAEALSHSYLAPRAATLQEQLFAESSRILVMSQGMSDLYARKYKLNSRPLEHSYLEEIPTALPTATPQRQAFWGGAIYGINSHSMGRVAKALEPLNCSLLVASSASKSDLDKLGVSGDHVKTGFYSQREAYLQALREQGLLLLALDWPDESKYHEDELGTIFPTKTPEYLASGRPILVHCPEQYFLARFFRERGCGTVVTERSVEALREAARTLLDDKEIADKQSRAALEAAKLFATDRIVSIFQEEVAKTAKAGWGQQVA